MLDSDNLSALLYLWAIPNEVQTISRQWLFYTCTYYN